VWVDGSPRVACVTPVRRLDGRMVTTLDGLPEADRLRWADALVASGGSQCGFCTPGIVMRLAALENDRTGDGPAGTSPGPDPARIAQSLVAHLCRCTGWQTIEEAAAAALGPLPASPATPGSRDRDLGAASARAGIEGGVAQKVGPEVVLGRAGFADDSRPAGCLVAVPDGHGEYVVAESVAAARTDAGKVQGRSTSLALSYPVAVPTGSWDLELATTWVEPAYVEPDASWASPGEDPASPYANGGAFGGKLHSPVTTTARRLAVQHGRPVAVLWSREDVVRLGPKRPPLAGGIGADGTGVLRVGLPDGGVEPEEWAGVVSAVAAVAPGLVLEPVVLAGPPISFDLRAAVWAEAAVLAACAGLASPGPAPRRPVVDVPVEVTAPSGGRAVARCRADGTVEVEVDAGDALDEVVLRSYAIGATHQALSWVRSEGIAVDAEGVVRDLTVRSFGIVQARAMPRVEVTVLTAVGRPAVNGSDAVFAAVAAAQWLAAGLVPRWPTDRAGAGRR
jgi:xanthine dehydrogenase small subunit